MLTWLLLTSLPAHTQTSLDQHQRSDLTDLLGMPGKCEEIVLYGKSAKKQCQSLFNTVYKDGRSGFYFIAEDMILTFSGNGDQQLRQGSDKSTQAIDLVLMNKPGKGPPERPEMITAIGECSFENPFLGKPTIVKCSAKTEKGTFAGAFYHDGSEPYILIKDGKPTQP